MFLTDTSLVISSKNHDRHDPRRDYFKVLYTIPAKRLLVCNFHALTVIQTPKWRPCEAVLVKLA
jgi:hypothetical protein